ncbi:head-tail adaptor protein [Pararhodobacter aggregans]|uniref:Phage tail protein n=1 Tax=Pararhodobacter aggregans TaxID=404875 RepID=A0A2T7UWY6_9RHOB|nr:head-tail adaptor protein [Pararhodobacter aggregans]PTX04746.1 head-tail adaptor [Pararhodobacter aggregans]PVE49079.1 phage tail protein [Pararhodobacter aggregans]
MAYAPTRPMALEEALATPDGAGGYTTTWSALGTLWCELRAGAGSERRGLIAPEGRMLFRIFLRAAPQGSPQRPRPGQRLTEGARIFTILAVSEADAAGAWLVCHAREEVPA